MGGQKFSIESKVALLLTTVATVSLFCGLVITYLVVKPSLGRLFVQLDLQRVEPWARSLESVYRMEGSWETIRGKEHELFQQTQLSVPTSLEARVRLFDGTGKPVLGGGSTFDKELSLVLHDGDKEIGYLTVAAPERGYLEEQFARSYLLGLLKTVALLELLLVLFCGITARLFARHFLRPINSVLEGARILAGGDYQFEMPSTGRLDELGTLSSSFNRLAQTLRAAEQSRNEWIADTSHELRTPLAVLQAEIEALQDGIHQPDERSLAVLHREVVGLTTLVNELSELAKADMGGLAYRFTAVDLGILISETVEGFRERFSQLSVSVDIKVRGTCRVRGDRDRLRQLWSNLLENSLRYTDSPGTVRIDIGKRDSTVTVTVDDSKPGVPDESLPRLFERFFRADPSRTRGRGGSGIGLALVKKIVLAHGGSIRALHSELGGVRIEIQLPLG